MAAQNDSQTPDNSTVKSEPVLKIDGVTVRVPDGDETLTILDEVSMEVSAGEVAMLTGVSGSGKSTLLAVAGLLRRADSGSVTIAGIDTEGLSQAALTKIRRDYIGIIYQGSNLFPSLTALEQVELVAHISGQLDRAAKKKAVELLELVGLSDRMRNRPAKLSGGEKQRVGIARALMNEPAVLLADEPTAALDSARGRSIMEVLTRAAHERSIATLIVTHTADQLLGSDSEYSIHEGQLTKAGN